MLLLLVFAIVFFAIVVVVVVAAVVVGAAAAVIGTGCSLSTSKLSGFRQNWEIKMEKMTVYNSNQQQIIVSFHFDYCC